MALTRNQRRKAAKARLTAKSERIAKASLAHDLDKVRNVVKANMGRPMQRNYYPQSSMASLAGESHRGYVCNNTSKFEIIHRRNWRDA